MDEQDFLSSPQIKWGLEKIQEAQKIKGKGASFLRFFFHTEKLYRQNRYSKEGYRIEKRGDILHIFSENAKGALYALLDIRERLEISEAIPDRLEDAPFMKYRGYALSLQKQTGHFPDHKYYDWPISKEHFPKFYNKEAAIQLLDTLAKQRCNMLVLWSGHPFSSLLKLKNFPEMLEVDQEQFEENVLYFHWLIDEAKRRNIRIFLHFYNIHIPDPLAKKRGWNPMKKTAEIEVCNYTKEVISAFVQEFSEVGLIVCLGEVLEKKEKRKWLMEVILPGALEGVKKACCKAPPIILREHTFDLAAHLDAAKKLYPSIITMMKHNSENLISRFPDPANFSLQKKSKEHIVNVHLLSNLEPFTWGSPKFIRESVEQMVRQDILGVHVFPLRFWDWPNSAHLAAAGDQLFEHFLWWQAWGRYSWNPFREETSEEKYWIKKLCGHYGIEKDAAKSLLFSFQETGEILPEIATQFLISSGNRQNLNLGQFLIPLAFTRLQYNGGRGYSMSQLCGFPLIGEKMWSLSPIKRMQIQKEKCEKAAKALQLIQDKTPFIRLILAEVEVMLLLAEYYKTKSQACAYYFQILYGSQEVKEKEALTLLRRSVAIYRDIVSKTLPLFKDAGSLHLQREIPLSADKGYLHWKDCLSAYEKELAEAEIGGVQMLLKNAAKRSSSRLS